MIKVQELTKYYGSFLALNQLSFSISKGEIVGFLGPNGAGKTTTMKILTCYMAASGGTAEIDGMDIRDRDLDIRKRIGYLPENAPLYEDMVVIDFLKYILELRMVPRDRWKALLEEVVGTCGLNKVLGKRIGELSKGFRRRTSLAQALIHKPDLLILDEPTEGLDPNQIVEIRNLIRRIGKEKTILLSSHILSEVEATCSRVLIINQGKIVADGTTEEIQAHAAGQSRIHLLIDLSRNGAAIDDILGRLGKLEGVANVRSTQGEGKTIAGVEVNSKKGADIRGPIFDLAVREKWKLLELKREMMSLEDVFRRLTTK